MSVRILVGDALTMLRGLESESVQCSISSPPYYSLRDYQVAGQIGLERTLGEYVEALVTVYRELRRVMRKDSVVIVNLGDSYAGSGKGPTGHNGIGDQEQRQGFIGSPEQRGTSRRPKLSEGLGALGATSMRAHPGLKAKDLMMVPFRVALALQADGWYLRSVMPWLKRNSMPESVTDRPATAVEYLFMFSKSSTYYWDPESIRQSNTPTTVARHSGPERRYADHKTLGTIAPGHPDAKYPEHHHKGLTVNGGGVNGRSYRNSDPFFATWQGLMLDDGGDPLALVVNPKPSGLQHFASYPDTLVAPFVKAGTSEKGACPACGAPWARVVEREVMAKDRQTGRGWQAGIAGQENWVSGTPTHSGLANSGYQRGVTTGWAPSCQHPPADPVPCVILDPFLGSGTTLMVASRLGRDGIGVELSPTYARMAEDRIQRDAGALFPEDIQVTTTRQPTLFDEQEAV